MKINAQNIVIGSILVAGITLVSVGTSRQLAGTVSGQGSTISQSEYRASTSTALKPAALQYAIAESVGAELATGMILILFGLAVHVYCIIRKQPLTNARGVHLPAGKAGVMEILRISVLRSRSNRPRRR